jgi:proteasome assembly chaperone (PAC2) family protein
MHVEPVLTNSLLVLGYAGWSDAGDSATSAVRYLDATLHTAALAEIDSEEFFDFTVRRPDVISRDDGSRRIVWPATQLRFGSLDGERELVTGMGAEPHLKWRTYCENILALVRRLSVKSVVLLGAYQADVVYSQPVPITGVSSDDGVLSHLEVERSEYQGPTGIVGVLGAELEAAGVPFLSLWAGLPHYVSISPNPRGALALLKKLCIAQGLQIDLKPLRKSAAEFEERISKLVAADPELSDYVRQLKRRAFAR